MHAYLLPIKEHIQTDRSITTALKSVLELVGTRIWITSSCAMKAVYRLHSEVFLVDICQPLGAATVWPFYRDGAATSALPDSSGRLSPFASATTICGAATIVSSE